jgi:hypothetical protein
MPRQWVKSRSSPKMEMVFFFFERAVHPFWGKAHTRTNQGSEVRDGAVVGLSQQLTYI